MTDRASLFAMVILTCSGGKGREKGGREKGVTHNRRRVKAPILVFSRNIDNTGTERG